MKQGYVFIRCNDQYDSFGVGHIGYCSDLDDHEKNHYFKFTEWKPGHYAVAFFIKNKPKKVMIMIMNKFRELNVKPPECVSPYFFDKEIIPLIEPFLKERGIKYTKV